MQTVVEEAGFSVVRASSATASAAHYHEDPHVPELRRARTAGRCCRKGMTIAIEPMITAGGPDVVLRDDEWTIATADGSLSAHFEHTVAITADGPRILTARAADREFAGLLP